MKKVLSIIFCLVFVFAMAATAFAATDDSQLPGNTPNDPAPDLSILWNITNVVDLTEETNPTTGAPVYAIPVIAAILGGAVLSGKRK